MVTGSSVRLDGFGADVLAFGGLEFADPSENKTSQCGGRWQIVLRTGVLKVFQERTKLLKPSRSRGERN